MSTKKPVNADARVRQTGGKATKAIFIQLFADGLVDGFCCALFETELEFVDEIRVDIDHTIDTFGQLLVRVYLAGLRVGYRTGRDQVLRQGSFVLAQVNLDTIGRQKNVTVRADESLFNGAMLPNGVSRGGGGGGGGRRRIKRHRPIHRNIVTLVNDDDEEVEFLNEN